MIEKLWHNKDRLYQKYITEKLSTYKIAENCECEKSTILNWLRKHNIKIRTPLCSLEERLWAKVDKKDNISECWPWLGCKRHCGYGTIRDENDGKMRPAHVVMYKVFYKNKVKKREVIHHLCENKSCCNPHHLVKMTDFEHRSLHIKGEKHPNAKLTWEEVRQIRKKYTGERGEITKLAKKYNVTPTTICSIVNNKMWIE